MTCLEEKKENILSFHLQQFSKKSKPLSPFISKLRFLLNSTKYHHAIHWSSDGRAIVITDIESFKQSVLENEEEMFKTRNFTSFVRQLNLYGFRKVPSNGRSDPMSNMKFEHLHFRRERPDLMHMVHRTCLTNSRRRLEPTGSSPTRCLIPNRKIIPNKCSNKNTSDDVTTTHVKLTIPPKHSLQTNVQRMPLGLSMLQNFNQQKEKSLPLYNEMENHSVKQSLLDISSLEASTVEYENISLSLHEHNYALPGFQTSEIDEKATFKFLNDNFNAEIDVVKTLLSLRTFKPTLAGVNLDALSTLADVSAYCSSSSLTGFQDHLTLRSASNATPMETLNHC